MGLEVGHFLSASLIPVLGSHDSFSQVHRYRLLHSPILLSVPTEGMVGVVIVSSYQGLVAGAAFP
jgi:hypothetical protein